MAIRYSEPYSVITSAADTPPPPEPEPEPPQQPGTLEPHPTIIKSRTFSGGEPPMLEMIVYKSQGGRSLVNQFSNSYLFNGAPNYLSDAALTVLQNVANAERRIYFESTHFMRGVIRQLDESGRHIDGETRTHAFNSTGLNEDAVGAVIAPPHHVVAYEKRVTVGRPGISAYRNAIDSDEYNTYLESGGIPTRLNGALGPGGTAVMTFAAALMAADADSGLDMILPINPRYSGGAARSVIGVHFAGIRPRQETHDRKDGAENLREAVQQLINENGRAVRRLVRQMQEAAGPVLAALGAAIVALVQAALARYALLTIAQKAGIVWPAIYQASEVLALMAGA